MTECTNYWTFFCNPTKWDLETFLRSGEEYDTYTVTDWQAEWFNKGQLGIVRVGKDLRNKSQLNGSERLKSGIYAIVEMLAKPTLRAESKSDYWADEEGKKSVIE